ncbi:hypothetical protein DPMN_079804 [Dreissena polymorpha]|uniref:Uncharacterized protein n=1 Tax=Dreissena polymorpha TaxID=45954 RepID=A0A9D3YV53_DREPO|nr:hypothetical protein DPMN_079804 [Dreissena polymorpha]
MHLRQECQTPRGFTASICKGLGSFSGVTGRLRRRDFFRVGRQPNRNKWMECSAGDQLTKHAHVA